MLIPTIILNYTRRNTVSLTASAERNAGGRFGTMLLLREIVDTRNFLVPGFLCRDCNSEWLTEKSII